MNFKKCFKVKLFLELLFFISLFLLIGCATTSLLITVERPAEVNLKKYKKIAIGDIVNSNGKIDKNSIDIADQITTTLFSSGRFNVLDRQHLERIIKEHNLTVSGFINESTAAEIGKFTGTAALVFGRIQNDKYNEETWRDEAQTDSDGKRHRRHHRKGTYNLIVNLKIIDIKTSEILATKTIASSHTEKKSEDNKWPMDINKNVLYRKCIGDISGKFIKMIAPYKENVKATFQTDKMLPEINYAITQFKIGEWKEGLTVLEEATQKKDLEPSIRAKAYYDLGLAQMYYFNYEESIENLKKALKINPNSNTYESAVIKAKSEKEKAEKLGLQVEESNRSPIVKEAPSIVKKGYDKAMDNPKITLGVTILILLLLLI